MAKYRSVFVSDCHLGMSESSADVFTAFIEGNFFDSLYILGDLIDLWAIETHPTWPSKNDVLLRTILGAAETSKVVYVLGNHDAGLGQYLAGKTFDGVEVVQGELEYKSLSGERLLLCHGNGFDGVVTGHPKLAFLGATVNNIILSLDPFTERICRLFGYRHHWSLSGFVKNQVRNDMFVANFEKLLTDYARKGGYSGVVCGHIHRAKIDSVGGIAYYNCGDMVTSLTLLVETEEGEFKLLSLAH